MSTHCCSLLEGQGLSAQWNLAIMTILGALVVYVKDQIDPE
jgi:hypothetical protein